MSTNNPSMLSITLQLPPLAKCLIKRAAKLKGISMNEFVLQSALEEVDVVLEEYSSKIETDDEI